MKNAILSTSKLNKNFRSGTQEQQVLKNLDMELYEKDFTVIMGSSGAGKSTLLYALSGMDKVTGGSVRFFDTELQNLNADKLAVFRRRNCGFVFQQMFLLDNMSILDNILASGLLLSGYKKAIIAYAKELLTKVGLTETEWRKFTVVGLSNGSQMGGMNTSILTADFQRLNPDFKPQSLYIYLDKGTDAAAFCKTLESRFDKDHLKGALNFDKGFAEGMASYQSIVAAMGLAMLVITLVVIALVLYFVIGSTVIRRKKELGIQKAVGFTTLQLMNQIAVGFAVPVLAGVIIGGFLGAIGTNPMMSVIMRGSGVMKANFIVNPLWVLAFSAATFLFAYLLSLAVTRRIRKISAYALVTE